eukprot:127856-Hanusia_phi.AAC.1
MDRLSSVSGPCDAGYFCSLSGGVEARPNGSTAGFGPCPQGFYCPLGSVNPISCPPGTFAGVILSQASTDCQPCLAGFYCPTKNTSRPITCPRGHYCPTGTVDPSKTPCPIGSACPEGQFYPKPCGAGYYQDQ